MKCIFYALICTWLIFSTGCMSLHSLDKKSASQKNDDFQKEYIGAVFKSQVYQNIFDNVFMNDISKREFFKNSSAEQKRFLSCLSLEKSKEKFQKYSKPFILKHFKNTSSAKLLKEMKVLQDSDFNKYILYLSKSIMQNKNEALPNISPEKELWLQEVFKSAAYKDLRFLVGVDFDNTQSLLSTFSEKVRTNCMRASFR